MHLFAYLQAQRKQYKVHEAKASEASNFTKRTYITAGGLMALSAPSKSILAYLRGCIGLKCNDYIMYINITHRRVEMSY